MTLDTQIAAHESVKPHKHELHEAIIGLLQIFPAGLTADQAAYHLRRDKLTVRPRFAELKKQQRIYDTGRRHYNESGKKAAVFCVENPYHA